MDKRVRRRLKVEALPRRIRLLAKQPEVIPPPARKGKPKQFRLAPDVRLMIKEMAEATGNSDTAVVEWSVRWAHADWLDKMKKAKGA